MRPLTASGIRKATGLNFYIDVFPDIGLVDIAGVLVAMSHLNPNRSCLITFQAIRTHSHQGLSQRHREFFMLVKIVYQ